ncbi:hypothetical protein CLV85_0782 [Salinibacterium amurskyense]|uniref:Uncharacterized protein n=1 Tax=Salinibacterium amurskyense TaxID=205941 RepID=A0A2M9D7B0_9MICO|nr:hypothetical protein [Salinibacterium amurskyense]PJJ81605.1 hypothetical protein CLV85_0782 [Salinibacterium amurskyense]RLQ83589.1 hypothetical protein D9C83_03880 [Salinibacterium amurskyense]
MRVYFLISSWLVTALIAVLGVFAGQTIWFYEEPLLGAIVTPPSYYIAAYSGVTVLTLSFVQSVALSASYATRRAASASSSENSQ